MRSLPKPDRLVAILVLLVSFCAHPAQAITPHETLLLVNVNSAESKTVANHFVDLRGIPARNMIYLDLPSPAPLTISKEAYDQLIWQPVQRALRDRALNQQVIAWIFSVDFPTTIQHKPQVSLQGYTFCRSRLPSADDIKYGRWKSVLFGGPSQPGGKRGSSLSLGHFAQRLGKHMPIPCMALGHTGPNGNSIADIVNCLQRGVQSDSTHPEAPVVIQTNSNVRSTCRAWQVADTLAELKHWKIPAQLARGGMKPEGELAGYSSGFVTVKRDAVSFVPGAMAEHLTSHAGNFGNNSQMKCTRWIESGATATAGTITEPYAIWTKFPHTRYFVHLGRGLSILEGFSLSVRCPLQLHIIGEPFASPYAPPMDLKLDTRMVDDLLHCRFLVSPEERHQEKMLYLLLLDGKPLTTFLRVPKVSVPLKQLPPGTHLLRALAMHNGDQIYWARDEIDVTKPGSPKLNFSLPALAEADRDVEVALEAAGKPSEFRLYHGLREIARGTNGKLKFSPSVTGGGPVQLVAEVSYTDGRKVRSAVQRIQIR